ncbi:MAG: hypothetical protein K8R89_09565 [Anaerolineae bacterium]|nr:hypothetical protein [Anaerolineae bacterium]
MITLVEFRDRVAWFHEGVEAAYRHLVAVEQTIAQVGEMYPAIPAESWQDRNGKGKYLYMLFLSNQHGGYSGPDGKRKIYIGNKLDRIEAARQLAENRRRYEELQRARRELVAWIDRRCRALREQMASYPYPSAF